MAVTWSSIQLSLAGEKFAFALCNHMLIRTLLNQNDCMDERMHRCRFLCQTSLQSVLQPVPEGRKGFGIPGANAGKELKPTMA